MLSFEFLADDELFDTENIIEIDTNFIHSLV